MSYPHARRRNNRVSAGSHHPRRVHSYLHEPLRADRAQIVARLFEAEQQLSSHVVASALLLDGALADILAVWAASAGERLASRNDVLAALDARSPHLAARFRLALMAREPEARLAHCWAILDALTIRQPVPYMYDSCL